MQASSQISEEAQEDRQYTVEPDSLKAAPGRAMCETVGVGVGDEGEGWGGRLPMETTGSWR